MNGSGAGTHPVRWRAHAHTQTFRKDTPIMDHVHVLQRLGAFAARMRQAAGPGGPGGGSRNARSGSSGMRAMDSFGAGRR